MPDMLDELTTKVSLSCRILATLGLVKDILGHVSARIPGTDEMLIRCRGPRDRGVLFTSEEDIRRLDFDGDGVGREGGFAPPGELPIHGETLKRRAEVNCVIHAHPPGALLCGVAGVTPRPLVGSYDSGFTLWTALRGVPVFPHAYLISRPELAHNLIAFMGSKDVCIMRGHGVTVTGRSVEEATLRAILFEAMCRISWQIATVNGSAPEVTPETIAEYARGWAARSGGPLDGVMIDRLWRHYVALLEPDAPRRMSLSPTDLEI